MTKFRLLVAALAMTLLGGLAIAGASAANADIVHSITVKNRIDDNGWARDTFVRSTTISERPDGKYDVTIADKGTFLTKKGEPSPAASSVKLSRSLTGSFVGGGHYVVEGDLKTATQRMALPAVYDDTSGAQVSTGNWAKLYFKTGATSTGITGWKWTYATADETMVQEDGKPIDGNITGELSSELTVAGVCSTSTQARYVVKNVRGDRKRPAKYAYFVNATGKYSAAKWSGDIAPGASLTLTLGKGSVAVYYYDGYNQLKKIYSKVNTKKC